MATASAVPELSPQESQANLQKALTFILSAVSVVSEFEAVYNRPMLLQIAVEQVGRGGQILDEERFKEEVDIYLEPLIKVYISQSGVSQNQAQNLFRSVIASDGYQRKYESIKSYSIKEAQKEYDKAGEHLMQLSNVYLVDEYKLEQGDGSNIHEGLKQETFRYFNGKRVLPTNEVIIQITLLERFSKKVEDVARYLEKEKNKWVNRDSLFDFLKPATALAAAGGLSGKAAPQGQGYNENKEPIREEQTAEDYSDVDYGEQSKAEDSDENQKTGQEDEKKATAKDGKENSNEDKDAKHNPNAKHAENKDKEDEKKAEQKKKEQGKGKQGSKKGSDQTQPNSQQNKTKPQGGIAPATNRDPEQAQKPANQSSEDQDTLNNQDEPSLPNQDPVGSPEIDNEQDYNPVSNFQRPDSSSPSTRTDSLPTQGGIGNGVQQSPQNGGGIINKAQNIRNAQKTAKNLKRAAKYAKDPKKAIKTAKRFADIKKAKAAKDTVAAAQKTRAAAQAAKLATKAAFQAVAAGVNALVGFFGWWLVPIIVIVMLVLMAVFAAPAAATCVDGLDEDTAQILLERFEANSGAARAFERTRQRCNPSPGCVDGVAGQVSNFVADECLENLLEGKSDEDFIQLYSGGGGTVSLRDVRVRVLKEIVAAGDAAGVSKETTNFVLFIHATETAGALDKEGRDNPWGAVNGIGCKGIAQLCPGFDGTFSYEKWAFTAVTGINKPIQIFDEDDFNTVPSEDVFLADRPMQMRAIEAGLVDKQAAQDASPGPLAGKSNVCATAARWLGLGASGDANGTKYLDYCDAAERNFAIITCNGTENEIEIKSSQSFTSQLASVFRPISIHAQDEDTDADTDAESEENSDTPEEVPLSDTTSENCAPGLGGKPFSGNFEIPLPGGVFTSGYGFRFGRNHNGIDISTGSGLIGEPIVASAPGTVIVTYNNCPKQGTFGSRCGAPGLGGFGNVVVMEHNIDGTRYETIYAHFSKVTVVEGQSIDQGDKLGEEGMSGSSTGLHLHFEILRYNSDNSIVKLDPCTEIICPPIQGVFQENPK